MQHSSRIRSRYRRLHRISGYVVLLSSLILTISGLALPMRKLAYTSSNFWELHSLSLNPETFPTLAPILKRYVRWPTFHMSLFFVAPAMLLTTWRTFATISGYGGKRDVVQHQLWASAHAIIGYFIHLQRVVNLLIMIFGQFVFHVLSPEFGEWIGLPDALKAKTWEEKQRIVRIEQAEFALTAWVAGFVTILWFLYAHRRAGSPKMYLI